MYYLAIDIGASSGRHIIGYKENGVLKTEELYRFPNGPKLVDGHLTWDINYLFKEVKEGIKIALNKYQKIESMSIDTWGVDYVLLRNDEEILPCYCYRDSRTKEVISKVHEIIPFERLYQITGSQFQEFNTIYQLYSDKENGRLKEATSFLHIPEYLIYKLSGKMVHEYTNASTTGLTEGRTNSYSEEIISKLGFNKQLFTKLEKPGYVVGGFSFDIQKELGGNIKIKLCPTHDTASAVEGIEMTENALYLSSGTWSLLGIKEEKVITNKKAMLANYSNEYGPNYIRFQKNIMGLWIIQGLAKQLKLGFNEMEEMARESDYLELYDVNDKVFLSSLNMKDEIVNWFKNHQLPIPKDLKDIVNTTLRSLAKSYEIAVNELEEITNKKYDKLYIVGGGAKNKYLNELTEKFTKHKVIALPIEATAIGNLLSQMEE